MIGTHQALGFQSSSRRSPASGASSSPMTGADGFVAARLEPMSSSMNFLQRTGPQPRFASNVSRFLFDILSTSFGPLPKAASSLHVDAQHGGCSQLQQVCLATVANTLLKGAQLLHNISHDEVFLGKHIIGQQNMLCTSQTIPSNPHGDEHHPARHRAFLRVAEAWSPRSTLNHPR